jgi:hypothetical protein
MFKKIFLLLVISVSLCYPQSDTTKPVIDGLLIADTIRYGNSIPFCFIVKEKKLMSVNLIVDSAVVCGTHARLNVVSQVQLFDVRKIGDYNIIAGLYQSPLLTEGWHKMLFVVQDSNYNYSYRGWMGYVKQRIDTLYSKQVILVQGTGDMTYVDTTSTYPRDKVQLPPGSIPISRQYSSTTKKVTIYYLKPKQ